MLKELLCKKYNLSCILFLITLLSCMFLFSINTVFSDLKLESCFVKKTDNFISIDSNNCKIETIFNKISNKFNISVRIFPEMKNKKLNISISNLQLEDAIKRLVHGNYAITTVNDSIKCVYVLNQGTKFQSRNKLIKKFLEKKILTFKQTKDIVTKKIKEKKHKAKLFASYQHEDFFGNLRSYSFTFYTGNKECPPLKEVKKDIQQSWIRNSSLSFDKKNFITFEISADYDSPPVQSFHKGLPNDLTMLPNAEELLRKKIGEKKEIVLSRTFKLSLIGIGFEFIVNSKKNYYVDVLNKVVFSAWKRKNTKRSKPDELTKNRIQRQWLSFLE